VSTVSILFGTESGNSEMVADDLAVALHDSGIDSQVSDMENYDPAQLSNEAMVVVITSTYGEGDLPQTAIAFHEGLQREKPDLSSMRFAAFGLGDSTYATYNQAIETLVKTLTELGASQLGDTGYHDADSGLDASDCAVDWATTVFVAATT
jgi:MioC protein